MISKRRKDYSLPAMLLNSFIIITATEQKRAKYILSLTSCSSSYVLIIAED